MICPVSPMSCPVLTQADASTSPLSPTHDPHPLCAYSLSVPHPWHSLLVLIYPELRCSWYQSTRNCVAPGTNLPKTAARTTTNAATTCANSACSPRIRPGTVRCSRNTSRVSYGATGLLPFAPYLRPSAPNLPPFSPYLLPFGLHSLPSGLSKGVCVCRN